MTGAKRKGRGQDGPAGKSRPAPARAHARGKEGQRPGWVCRLRKKRERQVGWLGLKRKVERGEGFRVFFLNSFQIHFSNFQTLLKQETMHSNHDAQTLIISNFIKMMFRYFKGQFYFIILLCP
jgi:hypothetical protein